MSSLVLSLFPGIGLLDMAFEEAGFCVVRGPDLLWGGDVHRFRAPAGRFDGVVGGPPCQAFSRMRHLVEANGYETAVSLIPEFERVVLEAQPAWFLMENVPGAPEPVVDGFMVRSEMIADHWVGGETSRMRRFSFGTRDGRELRIETLALHSMEPAPAACASGGVKPGIPSDRRSRGKFLGWKTATALKQSIAAQGLPADFLDKAPFTLEGKHRAVGNGVPLAMGRAVAQAVARTV